MKTAYNDEDAKLLRLQQTGYKLFWIGIGEDDFLYDVNTAFRKRLDEMDFKYTYHESSRGPHLGQLAAVFADIRFPIIQIISIRMHFGNVFV